MLDTCGLGATIMSLSVRRADAVSDALKNCLTKHTPKVSYARRVLAMKLALSTPSDASTIASEGSPFALEYSARVDSQSFILSSFVMVVGGKSSVFNSLSYGVM